MELKHLADNKSSCERNENGGIESGRILMLHEIGGEKLLPVKRALSREL